MKEQKKIFEIKPKLIIDIEELEKQIDALLNSNMDEDSKEGLHSLLGRIYDEIIEQY